MPESSQGVVEWSIGEGGASTTEHEVEANVKLAADAYGAPTPTPEPTGLFTADSTTLTADSTTRTADEA